MSLHLGHRHGRARRESSGDGRDEGREDWRRGKRGGDRGGERVQIAGTCKRSGLYARGVNAWRHLDLWWRQVGGLGCACPTCLARLAAW